jgi:hypothetical protein
VKPGVTAVIPTIPVPGREILLREALQSVLTQTEHVAAIALVVDWGHEGAAQTRQRGLDMVDTEWVSFLDDDDLWHAHHVATHMRLLGETGADVAYSWFDGNNPFPMHRGRPFDPENPHHLTTTLTVRTGLARQAGFLGNEPNEVGWVGEDWHFILRLCDLGARFVGTGDVTWTYRLHGGNTSGLPSRW